MVCWSWAIRDILFFLAYFFALFLYGITHVKNKQHWTCNNILFVQKSVETNENISNGSK